ncbi:MAG: hypothetical protein CMK59_14470 [Proteobacteria bacterium]|nr:hypothetical protein [Pseudomonadota bacterium]
MNCVVNSGTLIGVEAKLIQVEIDLLRRLPSMIIVGLPSGAVRESADRVRSALMHSGFVFPKKRIVVNLAPADIKKQGSAFDLPIALALLSAQDQLPPLHDYLIAGELSLSGQLRPIKGALSLALLAKDEGIKSLILPKENAAEANAVSCLNILGADSLLHATELIKGEKAPAVINICKPLLKTSTDMRDVKGMPNARRALEIAAAGGHNLLLIGPPGSGKSLLARCLPTILPPLNSKEAISTTQIHSAAGLLKNGGLMNHRPFRAPHHSISSSGMIGTAKLTPGEASLAHNGVLFLDEFPEFRRDVLEALRAPLEDKEIRISRAGGCIQFPAAFSLIAAANPCPCGYWGSLYNPCKCQPYLRERYQSRFSGPILDRFDLLIKVNQVNSCDLLKNKNEESSHSVQERVIKARHIQENRYNGTNFHCNAQVDGTLIKHYICLSPKASKFIELQLSAHNCSGRTWIRILKTARTIADLANSQEVEPTHLIEALSLKILEDL